MSNYAPCRGCTDRQTGCHVSCASYIRFKEERAAEAKKAHDYAMQYYYSAHRSLAKQALAAKEK